MSNTGYQFNNEDLVKIFSSTTGNLNTYSNYYKNLSNLDIYNASNNVLKGTAPIGYKAPIGTSNSAVDIVTVFSPIYYDVLTTTSTITIPSWVNKIGFVIQAGGGDGGVTYTDYWLDTTIPSNYQYGTRNTAHTVTVTNGVASHYVAARYTTHNVLTGRFIFGGPGSGFGSNPNYGTFYGHNYTTTYYTNYTTTYSHNFTTNYSRSSSSQVYYGSGGGGGACTAGLYTINSSDRPATMSISVNFNNSYSSIQFNDSLSTVARASCGNKVTANTGTGTSVSPIVYTNNINTTTDTAGTGGGISTNSFTRISNYYSVAGSNGGSGTTSVAGSSGNSGIANDPTTNSGNITNNYIPNITTTLGNGGAGTSGATVNPRSNGIVRYWFIR